MLATRSADRLVTILAAAGVAAMLGIGIELTEWTAFTHPVATGYGAYRDTIGDLGMDVAGAATVTAQVDGFPLREMPEATPTVLSRPAPTAGRPRRSAFHEAV